MLFTDNEITLVFFCLMVLCLALYVGLGWLATSRKRNAFINRHCFPEIDPLYFDAALAKRARYKAEFDAYNR